MTPEEETWKALAEFWRTLHEKAVVRGHEQARRLWWLVVFLVAIDFGQAFMALTR